MAEHVATYEELLELAQEGDVEAQNSLGILYATGSGVAQATVTRRGAGDWSRTGGIR